MQDKNNIHLASTDTCTGCSACVSVCPTGSISMKKDREDLLQPHIDTDHARAHGFNQVTPRILNGSHVEHM